MLMGCSMKFILSVIFPTIFGGLLKCQLHWMACKVNGLQRSYLYFASESFGSLHFDEYRKKIWLLFLVSLRRYFSLYRVLCQSLYRVLCQRRKKKREQIDERKMSKQTLSTPTASAICPCSIIIQISRTPRH